MFFLEFIVQQKREDLTWKVPFTTFLKPTRTKKKKKKVQQLGENPQNYESVHNETSVYEQKPIKIDDFNEAEEKENKEHVEKRKIKRREVAEKNYFF